MPVNTELSRENWERYVYIRDGGHLDYVKKHRKCENFIAGLQWEESIRRRLESQGKPVITVNEVFASFAALTGELIRNQSDVAFLPAKSGKEEISTTLTKMWRHTSRNNKFSWLRSEVAADGFVGGRGFFDVRASFDDHLMGEVVITKENPINILIDPDAEEYDPKTWSDVIKTKWMSPKQIETLYSKEDAELLSKRSSAVFGYDSMTFDNPKFDTQTDWWKTYDRSVGTDELSRIRRFIRVLERQYRERRRVPHFVDIQTGDIRRVPPTWDKERMERFVEAVPGLAIVQRMTSVVKWCVTADDVVLHEAESPYKDFTIVPYFPYFRYGRTIGLLEHALSPQEMFNKTISQELHVVNTTANSGYLVKKGSLQNMSIEELERRGAETGIVIELDDIANLDKITPNQVPTGLDRLSFKAGDYIQRVLNVPDSSRGFDRSDVAARSTEIKKQQAASALAKPLENLNLTEQLVCERVVDIYQSFYTDERVFQITGMGPFRDTEEVVINRVQTDGTILNDLTIGEYAVAVTSVPPADTFEDMQFAELMQMRQLQIPIPDKFLIESSRFARKAELLQEMQEASGESAQAQQALMQLQAEIQQLEVEVKKADIAKTAADARLSDARAFEVQANAGQGPNGDLEAMQMQEDIRLRWEELAADMELERARLQADLEAKQTEFNLKMREMEQKMALEREKARAMVGIAREKMQGDREIALAEADEQAELAREKNANDLAIAKDKAKTQAAIAKTKAKAKPAAKKKAA